MGHNTFKAVHEIRSRLETYPWLVSVGLGTHQGQDAVIVTTHVHVPSKCKWLIPTIYLGLPVIHRKIGSPSPSKGA